MARVCGGTPGSPFNPGHRVGACTPDKRVTKTCSRHRLQASEVVRRGPSPPHFRNVLRARACAPIYLIRVPVSGNKPLRVSPTPYAPDRSSPLCFCFHWASGPLAAALTPTTNSMAYAISWSLALLIRWPIGRPMAVPRYTSGRNATPIATFHRMDGPNVRPSRRIWTGMLVAKTANRNPRVLCVDQSCAMDHRTKGGPPIPDTPAKRPLAVKASPAQPQCIALCA